MRFIFKISWERYLMLLFSKYLLLLFCTNSVAALTIKAESPCYNTHVSGFVGTITSPNYPKPYPDEVECEWEIRAPINSALSIRVEDLDIREDDNCRRSPCCSHHRLSISRDGGSILLCGNNTMQRTITVFQPLTLIKYFSSKANMKERGFKISYSVNKQGCGPNEFQCRNGKCYPASIFCNGHDDCGDGSDEIYCPHGSLTVRYDTLKRKIFETSKHRIEAAEMCKEGSVPCPLSPDHCYSLLIDQCDDKFDCPKGEDEVDCVPTCPKQISCSSGDGCYYPSQRCNSVRDCRDNSDETGCPSEPCVALQFTCLNGACVSGSAICDGDDDCGDLSDEENCTKSSFMKAAVVGLLTCIMVFCIVLGCMYHVYTARLRASANFVHQLETETSDDDFMYREPPPAYSVAVNEPGILTYPSSEGTERFFESEHPLPFQSSHSSLRTRWQHSLGNAEPTSTQRPRHRNSGAFLTPHNCLLPGESGSHTQQKANDNSKAQNEENMTSFHQVNFSGFDCPSRANERTLPTNTIRTESPCSSLTMSQSRESITSCTSIEEIEDLVSLFNN